MSEDKNVSECTICLCSIEETEVAYRNECGHLFHKECIGKWLNNSNNCPNCKAIVPVNKTLFPNYNSEDRNGCNWQSEVNNDRVDINTLFDENNTLFNEGWDPNITLENIRNTNELEYFRQAHIRSRAEFLTREIVETPIFTNQRIAPTHNNGRRNAISQQTFPDDSDIHYRIDNDTQTTLVTDDGIAITFTLIQNFIKIEVFINENHIQFQRKPDETEYLYFLRLEETFDEFERRIKGHAFRYIHKKHQNDTYERLLSSGMAPDEASNIANNLPTNFARQDLQLRGDFMDRQLRLIYIRYFLLKYTSRSFFSFIFPENMRSSSYETRMNFYNQRHENSYFLGEEIRPDEIEIKRILVENFIDGLIAAANLDRNESLDRITTGLKILIDIPPFNILEREYTHAEEAGLLLLRIMATPSPDIEIFKTVFEAYRNAIVEEIQQRNITENTNVIEPTTTIDQELSRILEIPFNSLDHSISNYNIVRRSEGSEGSESINPIPSIVESTRESLAAMSMINSVINPIQQGSTAPISEVIQNTTNSLDENHYVERDIYNLTACDAHIQMINNLNSRNNISERLGEISSNQLQLLPVDLTNQRFSFLNHPLRNLDNDFSIAIPFESLSNM